MVASECRLMEDSPRRSMEVSARRAVLTLSGLGGCGCFAANSSSVRIFTALQDAVDSVGVIGRCFGVPVDRYGLVYVDRCSRYGLDRHHCDLPKLIKLSTSKSPSCSFSSFTICQKSSSMMAFMWCFITSSPTPLVEVSCLLTTSPVCITCISRFFT